MDSHQLNLPQLTWNYCWEGEVVLPSWQGFQTRRGQRPAIISPNPSDGSTKLRVDTDGAGRIPPTEAQIAAYRWLLEHEAEVAAAVLNAIFAEYPRFRAEFLDAYEEGDPDAEATVPPLERPEQLKSMMGLYAVYILPIPREGVGYVGFQFGCDWEEEHGLGVLLHKARIVEIGQAPTAFDGNRAEEDSGD
jgi:hypothetical protein